ncbi:hypothetical protein H9623_14135 [Oerskovia sp. Sa1BUA8]|uniref:Uncharacterized protein n=1 Tax=Oerskovia douganii TaxID=2762210 RepID=A0A9D5UAQ5_9CELL|nr:hypothetical protein [Oerskovia douganii]MBE7701430.1 hypothetical protein [Oerskovia douganii]
MDTVEVVGADAAVSTELPVVLPVVHRSEAAVSEVDAELDVVDWAAYQGAFGAADVLPDLVRAVVGPPGAEQDEALDLLWQVVNYEGALYEVSVPALRVLTAMVRDERLAEDVRSGVALLLLTMGAAHLPGEPAEQVDLQLEVLLAAQEVLPALDRSFLDGPRTLQVALLAFQAVTGDATSAAGRAAIARLVADDDPLVAAIASLTFDLVSGAVPARGAVHRPGILDEDIRELIEDYADLTDVTLAGMVVSETAFALVDRMLSALEE